MGDCARFLVALTALQAAALRADSFSIANLGSFGGQTNPTAINNAGQVVGYSLLGQLVSHPFLYSAGSLTDLGTLGGIDSAANAINSSGQIVGTSELAGSQVVHAFLYSEGTLTDLGTLGGPLRDALSDARGINASGQIVGVAQTAADSPLHGFLYSAGTMMDVGLVQPSAINDSGQIAGSFVFSGSPQTGVVTHAFLDSAGVFMDLGSLGGQYTYTTGINNAGEVVGTSYLPGASNWHAFLYSAGTMKDLGTLNGGPFSEALGINNSGQIVGDSTTNNFTYAILYTGGVMYDLNTFLPANSGWHLVNATAINDAGQIAGWGFYNNAEAAFLLTPQPAAVPEPGYWPLWLACVAAAPALNSRRFVRKRRLREGDNGYFPPVDAAGEKVWREADDDSLNHHRGAEAA
jgi:probable HAF family extracellular repeat protein